MIRTYWKQLLVTAYIAMVLILSATAKAESVAPSYVDDDLSDLQSRIEGFQNHVEPAVFSKQQFQLDDSKSMVKSFEDRGQFMYENTTSKLVFISEVTGKIYYVRCEDDLRSSIESDKTFAVKGFSFSQESINTNDLEMRPPSHQQVSFLNLNNFIFVTGVEIQR